MSASMKQPVGQKRLTNIAVVRFRKNGNRFEVACYKNKVLSWRSGVEKDIDEVLQTHSVFSNVGKGTIAKSKDLKEAFGTSDEDVVSRLILEKGELQVSDKERESHVSTQFRDVVSIVTEKTINPDTQRPYTIGMVEKFVKEVHFSVDPHRSSKQQALELIHKLEEKFPITRARMELRLTVPSSAKLHILSQLDEWKSMIVSEKETGNLVSVICQVDPGRYRQCDALVHEHKGRIEVVSMAVQKEWDGKLEAFDPDFQRHPSEAIESGSNRDKLSDSLEQKLWIVEPSFENQPSVQSSSSASATFVVDGDNGPITTAGSKKSTVPAKVYKCNTCCAEFSDAKLYREHFKSDWHKHNLKRKVKNLSPLNECDCLDDPEIAVVASDLHEYSR